MRPDESIPVDAWDAGPRLPATSKGYSSEARSVKVLHIVGSARAGSTIIGNVLGAIHVGELHNLWHNYLLERPCGCGLPLTACPIWSEIVSGGSGELADPPDLVRFQRATLRTRRMRHLVRPNGGSGGIDPLDSYRQALEHVYHGLADVAGADVIVDSSKVPPHAAVAASLHRVTPYFIHLVRDPRGVAYSREGNEAMRAELRHRPVARRLRLIRKGWQWSKTNAVAELACWTAGGGRVLRLRYEDFVSDPRRTLETALELTGERRERLPLLDDHTAVVPISHTVGGNSIRFKAGALRISPDTRWIGGLDRGDTLITGAAAFPLLHRYGYRLATTRS
jgi:hypothetical protein